MPKSSRKSEPRKRRQLDGHGGQTDFTLADFADAHPAVASPSRIKKGDANGLQMAVKQAAGGAAASVAADSLAWDEKDLDDFDVESPPRLFPDEDAPVEDVKDVRQSRGRPKNPRVEDQEGHVYPLDIWFMISDHVLPEDIPTFACICKGAHIVVHSAQFWISLYHRFYRSDVKNVPECLQRQYAEKVHGLMPRVARSLYYFYPLFEDRVKRKQAFQDEPTSLEGMPCILMWYQKENKVWHFFFKFRRSRRSACFLTRDPSSSKDPFSRFAVDIMDNPESDCCVLQVLTGNFMTLPIVMGQTLRKISLSVGYGMRYHKLKMLFGTESGVYDRGVAADGSAITMDPVINMRVLQWWDPKYPYPGSNVTSPT